MNPLEAWCGSVSFNISKTNRTIKFAPIVGFIGQTSPCNIAILRFLNSTTKVESWYVKYVLPSTPSGPIRAARGDWAAVTDAADRLAGGYRGRGGDVGIVAILEAAMRCDLRGQAIYENFLPSVNKVCTMCAVCVPFPCACVVCQFFYGNAANVVEYAPWPVRGWLMAGEHTFRGSEL